MFTHFLVISIFQCSPTFKNRINTAITEIQNSGSMEITSMGCRFWFYQNTMQLLKKHWMVGAGTGDFPAEYAKINTLQSPIMPNTDNPHNQYLLVTSQFGMIGLITLFAIFDPIQSRFQKQRCTHTSAAGIPHLLSCHYDG
jgi:O-antigen ligase